VTTERRRRGPSARNHLDSRARVATVVALLVAGAALVTACQPEPGPSPSPTVTPVTPKPEPTEPTPIESNMPDAGIEVPTACEDIYSADMLASLNQQNPPLNDLGVTMLSTEVVDGIEILESGVTTLRCSWGKPSEFGLATNVTVIGADQAETLQAAMLDAGFGCGDELGGTVCRVEQRTIDLDDNEVIHGEVHVLRDSVWISTRYINFTPDGYTEDIVATLWS